MHKLVTKPQYRWLATGSGREYMYEWYASDDTNQMKKIKVPKKIINWKRVRGWVVVLAVSSSGFFWGARLSKRASKSLILAVFQSSVGDREPFCPSTWRRSIQSWVLASSLSDGSSLSNKAGREATRLEVSLTWDWATLFCRSIKKKKVMWEISRQWSVNEPSGVCSMPRVSKGTNNAYQHIVKSDEKVANERNRQQLIE